MAFKQINDLNADTTVALGGTNKQTGKPNPTKAEGYYLGKRTVEDRKTKSGVSYIYILQTPKGNLGVWGKTDLNNKMANATPGHMLRITQSGKVRTPNGEMYKFQVEFDDTNTIEVAGTTSSNDSEVTAPHQYEDDAERYDSEGDYEVQDGDGEEQESYRQPAVVASSKANKDKVQALLNKGKVK